MNERAERIMRWENVYVFISSTFNDMHAERDYLVKKVFPQLSAWCEERKLRLVDIDLRWGVTEVDASENKRVVQVCLDRIDACRPFFLCFLGQRRGWVPDRSDISDETYAAFPMLAQKYAGSASVTELEILHALIDPLQNAQSAEHAFFFLRRPEYLDSLGNENLLNIYTNRAERDPATADAQLRRWREEIIPATGRPVAEYTADWDESLATPEIALPLQCPTTAPPGGDAWKNAFAKWRGQWRAAGVAVGEDGGIGKDAEREKALAYNANLTRGRLANFRIGGESLADAVLENLKAAIVSRFGAREPGSATPLQRELDQQAQFLRANSEGYVERADDFDALGAYLGDDESRPFAVVAQAGMGKTSLLAHFIDTWHGDAGDSLHYRFVGGGDDSVTPERLLRSLLEELREAGKLDGEIPVDTAEMMTKFPELLAEAGRKGRTIIVIDALNQFESGMTGLDWIPYSLPANVKMIISFKSGGDDADTFLGWREEGRNMILHPLEPFASMADREKLVTSYLNHYFKELDQPRLRALIGSAGADNPLFLKIALGELRVFGAHGDLTTLIRDNFGLTPVSAFDAVLARIETDPAYSAIPPDALLAHVFGWLAHSKHGLSTEELADLLLRENVTASRTDALDAVHLVFRQLRPYLARRDGRMDFLFESFRIAVLERYSGDALKHKYGRRSTDWHTSLARYFASLPLENRHKLMELAWQFWRAGLIADYEKLLCDYRFLKARIAAFDVSALLDDYAYGEHEPGRAHGTRGIIADALRLSSHVLSKHGDQLKSQLWGRLAGMDDGRVTALLEQIRNEEASPWLRPKYSCMAPPGSGLKRTFTGHTQVVGSVLASADGRHIVSHSLHEIRIWNLHTGVCRHTIPIRDDRGGDKQYISLSPDGRDVYYQEDNAIWAANLMTGRPRMVMEIVPCRTAMDAEFLARQAKMDDVWRSVAKIAGRYGKAVEVPTRPSELKNLLRCFALSPDGRILVAGGNGPMFHRFDLATGEWLGAISNKSYPDLTHPRIAIHGDMFATAEYSHNERSSSRHVRIVNYRTGEEEKAIEIGLAGGGNRLSDYLNIVSDIAFSPDGKTISLVARLKESGGDRNCALYLIDRDTGETLRRDSCDEIPLTLSRSPDGRLVAVGLTDGAIRVGEIMGEKHTTLSGHAGSVFSVHFLPDSRRLVSGGMDKTVRLWDLDSYLPEKRERRIHSAPVMSIALNREENAIVALSRDDFGAQFREDATTPLEVKVSMHKPTDGWAYFFDAVGQVFRNDEAILSANGRYVVAAGRNLGGTMQTDRDFLYLKRWKIPEKDGEKHISNFQKLPVEHRGQIGHTMPFVPSGDGAFGKVGKNLLLYLFEPFRTLFFKRHLVRIGTGSEARCRCVGPIDDDRVLAVLEDQIAVVHLKRRKIERRYPVCDLEIWSVALAGDGNRLAFCTPDRVGLLDMGSGEIVWQREPFAHNVLFSSDGGHIFALSMGNDPHSAASGDFAELASIEALDAATGESLTLLRHDACIRCMAPLPGENGIACGDDSGRVMMLVLDNAGKAAMTSTNTTGRSSST